MTLRSILAATVLCAAAFVTVSAAARSHVTYISGNTAAAENDPGGWVFARDPNNAVPYQFTFGPATSGGGSLFVPPISGVAAKKFIGELFLVTPMADVQSISYDFLIGAGGDAGDRKQYYANVYANFGVSSPTKFYDCRYDILPATGSTTSFTTVTFDPQATYPVATRGGAAASPFPCPASPAAMGAGATLRAFAINLGDTTNVDIGLDGYFDNVVVTTTSGETVYDFDPIPASKADCMNNGWRDYGDQFANQGQCVRFVSNGKRQ